jgi:hypothetical protein
MEQWMRALCTHYTFLCVEQDGAIESLHRIFELLTKNTKASMTVKKSCQNSSGTPANAENPENKRRLYRFENPS